MRIIGLDLSLVSTGVGGVRPGGGWAATIDTGKRLGFDRLRYIRQWAMEYVASADLVLVEGLSQQSRTGQHLTRAGLWHLVVERIDAASIPWCEVAPTAVKKFATGNGGAGKDAVLLAVERRWGSRVRVDNNNEADALTLAVMGAQRYRALGELAPAPKTHAVALDKVDWPELEAS